MTQVGAFGGEPCPKRRRRRNEDGDDDEGSLIDEDRSWRLSEGGSPKQEGRRSHGEQCATADESCGTPLRALLNGVSVRHGPSTWSGAVESFSRPLSTNVSVELTEDCDKAWEDLRPLCTEMNISKEGK